MSLRNQLLTICAGMFLAATQAAAQNKVAIKFIHPASFGPLFHGKRIVIGPVTGDCSKELLALVTPDIAAHGLPLVSSVELDAAAAEAHLQLASPLDPAAAAQLEKLLGPSLMLTGEILQCEARRREPMLGAGLPAPHISRVEGRFQARLRVIDLENGRELGVQTLRAEAQKENMSQTDVPEYPAQSDVREMVLAKALAQAQHLYLAWTEVREPPFFDGKECSLKQAFDLVKSGDYDGALSLLRENTSGCKSGPKTAAGAWYDLGVVLTIKQDYDNALAAFAEAQKLNSKGFMTEAIELCQRNKQLVEAARRSRETPAPSPASPVQTGIVLTNDFIIKMVAGNIADAEILKMIASQPGRFSIGPDDLLKLKNAGTSQTIISAIVNKK